MMQRVWKHLRHDAEWGRRLTDAGIRFSWTFQGARVWREPGAHGMRYRYHVTFNRPGVRHPANTQLEFGMSYHWFAPEVFQKIIEEAIGHSEQTAALLALVLEQMFLWTRKRRDIERRVAYRRERKQPEREIDAAAARAWLEYHLVEWDVGWSSTAGADGGERSMPKDQLWWMNAFTRERAAVREFEMVVGAELLETWLKLDMEKWGS
ncbi:hypothetical protein [Streptomyces sp. CBMA156]|uniref:hypothetical protein n=1 Tax=Streptomyces sp. CBMA156 TaxID=1930280 RepID=UPI001661DEE9|nr:hypothetical protein [Streptomyces sp. CBMA156]MBD0670049.1 hypothetical protein [Streptomyces sp. CBMA156]